MYGSRMVWAPMPAWGVIDWVRISLKFPQLAGSLLLYRFFISIRCPSIGYISPSIFKLELLGYKIGSKAWSVGLNKKEAVGNSKVSKLFPPNTPKDAVIEKLEAVTAKEALKIIGILGVFPREYIPLVGFRYPKIFALQ